MARSVVIGVDSSTQSCKVEARNVVDGTVVASASAPHPATTPPVSEQDPRAWWEALSAAFADLEPAVLADVVAISVGGQQHGLVLVDHDGSPVRPAKLWNDTTSAPQASAIVDRLGAQRWADLTGSVPVPAFTITKLAWIAENEPEALDRTAHVMLPHDYLNWRLTGEHVTDAGDASGSGWYNPSSGVYEPVCLDTVGLPGDEWLDRLPRVARWRERVGVVRPEVAAELGLRHDVVVGPGSGDNMAAALGIGLREGDVAISLGTSGTAYALSSTATHDPSGAVAGFASATGQFLPLVCTLNATKVTDTVGRWLGLDAPALAQHALGALDDPGTAVVVPYFDGERTPNLPDATGRIAGLTNATTAQQIALAAHDGVLCGLLDGVDALERVGATVGGSLHLVGGGARSVAYRQRLADLSNQVVIVPEVTEAVATGAAVQAAVVFGLEEPNDVLDRWQIRSETTVEPRVDGRDRRDAYQAALSGDLS